MRLFIAINFSKGVKNTLLGAISELRSKSISGSFTLTENLHLTLAFIGESSDVKAVRGVIDSRETEPFCLTIGGAGHFGDLYWVGIENNPKLKAFAESLQSDLRAGGFEIEDRAYKPHITIARKLVSDSPISIIVPQTSMTVTRISLMKSERVNGRLTYTEVYGRTL